MNNRVKELRTQRGLSQQQLGAAMDVSRQTINSIEKQRYTPSLPLAIALARYFGTHVEEIFHVDDHARPACPYNPPVPHPLVHARLLRPARGTDLRRVRDRRQRRRWRRLRRRVAAPRCGVLLRRPPLGDAGRARRAPAGGALGADRHPPPPAFRGGGPPRVPLRPAPREPPRARRRPPRPP